MESYFLCGVCGSLERSAIDIDLCTTCDRRYCSTHRRTHNCDDREPPQVCSGTATQSPLTGMFDVRTPS
jgi:hypothetical protein